MAYWSARILVQVNTLDSFVLLLVLPQVTPRRFRYSQNRLLSVEHKLRLFNVERAVDVGATVDIVHWHNCLGRARYLTWQDVKFRCGLQFRSIEHWRAIAFILLMLFGRLLLLAYTFTLIREVLDLGPQFLLLALNRFIEFCRIIS